MGSGYSAGPAVVASARIPSGRKSIDNACFSKHTEIEFPSAVNSYTSRAELVPLVQSVIRQSQTGASWLGTRYHSEV